MAQVIFAALTFKHVGEISEADWAVILKLFSFAAVFGQGIDKFDLLGFEFQNFNVSLHFLSLRVF